MASNMMYWAKIGNENSSREYLTMRSDQLLETDLHPFVHTSPCWGNLAMGTFGDQFAMQELHWFVEIYPENPCGVRSMEEFREACEALFPEGKRFGMDIEYTGIRYNFDRHNEACQYKMHPPEGNFFEEVVFKNIGDYPRQIMMNKLFTLRNLSRYTNYGYRLLKEAGVCLEIAVTLGANICKASGLANSGWIFPSYANALDPRLGNATVTVANVRNMAFSKFPKKLYPNAGRPWSAGNGYLRQWEVMGAFSNPDKRFSVCKSKGLCDILYDIVVKKEPATKKAGYNPMYSKFTDAEMIALAKYIETGRRSSLLK